jgi:hypothetical protein
VKITVIFDIDSNLEKDESKIVQMFEHYLYDMLFIDVEPDYDDVFILHSATTHLYEV